jgi:hypothetical protein
MKQAIKYLVLGLTVILMTSCGGMYNYSTVKSTSFSPDFVRLDLKVQDFEYLGETTISADYRFYVGIFRNIDSINGNPYLQRNVEEVTLAGIKDIPLSLIMKRAAYKVLDEYPEADFYVAAHGRKEKQQMFLGQIVKETVTIKAYKLR